MSSPRKAVRRHLISPRARRGTPAAISPGPGSLADRIAGLLESHPDRPSWDEYFMATALLIASRSACGRQHVGCILVSGGEHSHRIVAAGYNGYLPGTPHRSRIRNGHEQATVHAEQNAIADAARRGVSVAGSTAYVSHFPCIHCAKVLAAAGIRTVKYHFDYRNDPLVAELLGEAGVMVTRL
ncbi:MAG: deaminase [Acidobacteriota bacterium]